MKKFLIVLSLITFGLGGYLVYDWWWFTSNVQNATMAKSIYSWLDSNGVRHYSNQAPADKNKATVSNGYRHVSLPIVYRIRDAFYDLTGIEKDRSIPSSTLLGSGKNAAQVNTTRKNEVKIFTTANCGYCKTAKNYFNKKGIPFSEYDIEKSETARTNFRKYNGRGVPLIIVNGKRLVGFNPKAIEQHLN